MDRGMSDPKAMKISTQMITSLWAHKALFPQPIYSSMSPRPLRPVARMFEKSLDTQLGVQRPFPHPSP